MLDEIESWIRGGHLGEALQGLRRLAENGGPDEPGDALRLVRRLRWAGERDLAQQVCRQWPGNANLRVELAGILLRAGDCEGVVALLSVQAECEHATVGECCLLAQAHLAAGRVKVAQSLLDDYARRFGQHPSLLALKADILEASGRITEAIVDRRAALAACPDSTVYRRDLFRLLEMRARFAEVFDLLVAVVDSGNPSIDDVAQWLRCGVRAGCLERVAAQVGSIQWHTFPDRARVRMALLVLRAVGLGFSNALLRDGGALLSPASQADCRRYLKALASVRASDVIERLTNDLRQSLEDTRSLMVSALLARISSQDGLPPDPSALESLDPETVIDPADLRQFCNLLSVMRAPPALHGMLQRSVAAIDAPGERAKVALDVTEYLIGRDDQETARRLLASIDRKQFGAPVLERLRTLAKLAGVEDATPSPAGAEIKPDDVLEGDLLRHYRFGNERVVLWFGGVTPSGESGRQQMLLKEWRKFGISVITVHDHRRLAAMGGFGRHFPDRNAAERALAVWVQSLGYRQLLTSGASLSGASAFLYGVRMGAAGVLLFAGMTHLPQVDDIAANFGLLILHRLREEMKLEFIDAVTLLEACPNPGMIVHHYYGLGATLDAMQARHIAGLPGVTLFGEDHDQHDGLGWLRIQGRVEAVIANFVTELPAPTAKPFGASGQGE